MNWDGEERKESNVGSRILLKLNDIENKLDACIEQVNKHDISLYGDGNGTRGLKIDVDRLKEHRKNTEKTAFVVWSTAGATVLQYVLDFLRR